jgi:hypothetical protein
MAMSLFIQTIFCDVAQEQRDILSALLNAFIPEASIPNTDHLQGVFVVADSAIEQAVTSLLQQGRNKGAYVARAGARACTVPVETAAALKCYIVLAESLVNRIHLHNPFSTNIFLPLLKELLHVRLYSTLWQQQGFLHPQYDLACTADLFRLSAGFHDEYIVNRWKYEIMTTKLPMTHEEKPATLQLGAFPLVAGLEQAQTALFAIIQEAVAKTLPAYDAWVHLLTCLYKNIFELLARYEAPIAALGRKAFEAPLNFSHGQFYQQYVASYWEKIQKELERSFRSNIKETPVALQNIVKIMLAFLANIGVIYYSKARGDCQIEFFLK